MSRKRSHDQFARDTTFSQALQHVDELLRAAQALKHDLESGQARRGPEGLAIKVLRQHGQSLHDTAERFIHTGGAVEDAKSSKTPKLEHPAGPRSNLSGGVPIPTPANLTKWTISDLPPVGGCLPPLPPALDPALEKAALTHSGLITSPTDMSYERLEWIGDAYLYLMASAFIFQTFPNLSTGRSAQLRERLVKNETLSSYTMEYGINKRTRFPAEFDLHGRIGGSQASQKAKKKVLGDVFEAYVAAAILGDSGGLVRVATWLKALWSTEVSHEIKGESKASQKTSGSTAPDKNEQSLGPKVVLSRAIGAKGVSISYKDIGEPGKQKGTTLPWYTVGVYLDGWGQANLQLGFGSALSKKEAGAKAAQQALENRKLIKKFEDMKRDFQAALEAQQEEG